MSERRLYRGQSTDFCRAALGLEFGDSLDILCRPTPLEAREDLSGALGVRTFLKREDRSDDLGCGHKLRKLSYAVADALKKEASVLVTGGSLPSNQCKAVAVVANRLGLRAHVAFSGDAQYKPTIANGNYLLTTLCRPKITWRERSAWSKMPLLLEEIAREESKAGQVPYIIPPGISCWPGFLGSVELGYELAEQLDRHSAPECDIVCVAGSGGMAWGIALAGRLMGRNWKTYGICTGAAAAIVEREIDSMSRSFASKSKSGVTIDLDDCLSFTNSALGLGYDMPRKDEFALVETLVRRHGLLFDCNYMSKAYLGLIALLSRNIVGRRPIVLIHSGGQMGVFDSSPSWQQWHRLNWNECLAPPMSAASET
jgi:1-aminocyclopropane-1-carboxylate deaminase/D-cysteine desulfhydrase-like pyridoxal-dependent ACC family enzyme